ncbi:hypothetical protein QJS04_geneDACA012508 [Acorus gramineus]|uniref:Uncharacterized protein n=1 Tax=Acorus gramineus TaxID=55184 RepID=A0AAV9B8R8_ACOGR|nr:hypothetical protein QJS04_geneDACA012508 [Acorus gramineus]
MGCTASKLENEDTVRRCKERRRLMKEAVHSRHNLATAHSDYLRSLLLTGSALSHFAAGEPLSVSDQTPPVLLRSSAAVAAAPPQPTPPPVTFYAPSTIAESTPPSSPPQMAYFAPSSVAESTPPSSPPRRVRKPYPHLPANSNYSSTPSQASSVWNWENFYPPSPPDSEFFDRKQQQQQNNKGDNEHHLHEEEEEEERPVDLEREEVRCSEWGDHYSSGSSCSSDSRSGVGESKSERFDSMSTPNPAERSHFGSSIDGGNAQQPSDFSTAPEKFAAREKDRSETTASSSSSAAVADLKMVVRHRNLAEIVAAIEEYFGKAAAAGEAVSDLLETGRAQLDRSFRQLKKTVYHSSSVLSSISSSFSSKPPLAIKYRLETSSLVDSGGGRSHCSTLDRLLAWEKKLYEEVKAREGVKIEHEKKLSSLQSQEYRGRDDAKLDKTKASIQKLQSLIIVTSQAVTTTSSAIIKVRDSELAPQLVELCYGYACMKPESDIKWKNDKHMQILNYISTCSLMQMWRSMNQFHEATRHLEAAVSTWHSSFSRLIKHQRDYIRSLYGWLKLTLFNVCDVPDKAQPISSNPPSEFLSFCDELKQALDRLPDTVASEALKSFVNVINAINLKQGEELKIKKRAESVTKELEKKSTALRSIEKKFYHSYSLVGMNGLPPDDGGAGQVLDARDPLAEKKLEIAACRRRVEEEMSRHSKAVEVTRAMTLNNIQTGLPGVFQAMTGFSGLFAEALEGVCRQGGAI